MPESLQKSKGLFITFEGGEGSGKTTQVKMLAEYLEEQGRDVVLTREPGGTAEAEKIRDLLVQSDGGNWEAIEECLLLFAARSHHVRTIIIPALLAGKIVICDRFTDSTMAYQGYGLGLDIERIEQINKVVLKNFTPHITFLLDIPADQGLARSKKRLGDENSNEDKYESLDVEFHEKLRRGFLDLARHNPHRMHVINATEAIKSIHKSIARILEDRLP